MRDTHGIEDASEDEGATEKKGTETGTETGTEKTEKTAKTQLGRKAADREGQGRRARKRTSARSEANGH